jgi:hypothetical protein
MNDVEDQQKFYDNEREEMMRFKDLVFQIVFVVWIVLVSAMSGYFYYHMFYVMPAKEKVVVSDMNNIAAFAGETRQVLIKTMEHKHEKKKR